MNPVDAFRARLATELEQRDWKRAELARRVRSNGQTIGRYLNGVNGPPLGIAVRIADALGLTVDEMIKGPPAAYSGQRQVYLIIDGEPWIATPAQRRGRRRAEGGDQMEDVIRALLAWREDRGQQPPQTGTGT